MSLSVCECVYVGVWECEQVNASVIVHVLVCVCESTCVLVSACVCQHVLVSACVCQRVQVYISG